MSVRSTSAFLCLIGAAVIAAPSAYAWNLICGVSIGMAKSERQEKWNADSNSLYGISHFYAAVAELQRLELNTENSFTNPKSERGTGSATEQAASELEKSVSSLTIGLKIAEENQLGDEKGLGLLKTLITQVSSLHEAISKKKELPTLKAVQDAAVSVNEFTAYGIELSNKHLAMKMRGHGEGGSNYKIP